MQVDKLGKTIMAKYNVLHGTNTRFSGFDASLLGQNTDENATDNSFAQTAHLGFWFNAGGDLSIAYDIMMRCEIEINNPLEVDSLEALAYWVEAQDKTGEELREWLVEKGYDGIILSGDEEFGGTSFVVLSTDQITIK